MGVSRDDFLDRVSEHSGIQEERCREHLIRAVLGLLGEHLVGAERLDLAGCLPEEYAAIARDAPAADRPPAGERFAAAVAARTDATDDPTDDGTLRGVSAVLGGAAGPAAAATWPVGPMERKEREQWRS
ncbi:DUF2267 domain-containing protein [Kitasatospora sp. DSM 101779]|uniref:DUF2267 domain-containing protein n=1 Tax=Kitasatospora sp. DSM 101779 TaxID=2853165 RepID=UPI0021DB2C2D|nr:DUF2267 domain-containing protein [Kitasatospora sp. DSM 101779]MCU7826746.1 DUF2267 domain-containing protein [Kitasatospora sp. DSM 101779]